jgi:5'(3')-deoxyribonucleotidase
VTPSRQFTIAVDVDEVVVAMLPEWIRLYNQLWDDDLQPNEVTDWDLTLFVRPECGKKIYEILNRSDLYANVKLVPGALEAIAHLRSKGYRLVFVTSATKGHAGQKLQCLQDHGVLERGRQVDPDYVECTDKALIRADLIIDDRPLNIERFPGPGILFPCEHNKRWNPDAETAGRVGVVQGWEGIPAMVESFLVSHPIKPADTTALLQQGLKSSNPKDVIGSNKLPLHLWPASATAMGCLGFLDGMLKYGKTNFREMGVRASIYVDACKRHLDAWFEGEEHAPDSKIPHLAHALACIAIIVDADAVGKLEDDRMFNGVGYLKLVKRLTPHVARLKAVHADKSPRHFTIADNAALALQTEEDPDH